MSKATREAYGSALAKLIIEKEAVIVLDADLTKSTKTCDAKNACPQRHFNMGIAEGNMMSVAAGLAASNQVVYASSFAMFAAGRAFEQIRNSIAYPNLNVKICATHAGISVGEDGASHQAIEDLAIMRVIPNMQVFQPCDATQTEAIIRAVYDIQGPCYIRLGRLGVDDVYGNDYSFTLGKGHLLKEGKNICLIASGMMVQESLKAYIQLKENNIKVSVVDMPSIKPIDENLIKQMARQHDIIITIEEHSVIGGLGSAVAEVLASEKLCKQYMIGMQDCFGESGTPYSLLDKYGLTADNISTYVKEVAL